MLRKGRAPISPWLLVFASLFFVIISGFLLLLLPQMRTTTISMLDTFFVAVSSTCVTGLSVIPISSFTMTGKCVILGLIQVGGLGLMTLSLFLISLFLNFGIAARVMAGQILSFEFWGKIKYFLTMIISITFIVELLGALCLLPTMLQNFPLEQAIFYAFFYSVSSFCNAGISPIDSDIMQFSGAPAFLSTIGFLVFAGSLGFFVWYEILVRVRKWIFGGKRRHKRAWPLHVKISLLTTLWLIAVGAILLFWLERHYGMPGLSNMEKFFSSLFNAATIRCSGFTTLDYSAARAPTMFAMLFFMFVGAGPGSTGSGVKTSTAFLFFATIVAILRNRDSVEVHGRTIPSEQVYKAIAVITISLAWIGISAFFLLITENGLNSMALLFEAVASFSTCGLSTGITAKLSSAGKIIVMINMIVGRIGPLTMILSLRRKHDSQRHLYPEERILLG
ncbi:hypothetical protein HOD08_02435 [bacterium]|nr:hypothetical protein [bacterium]